MAAYEPKGTVASLILATEYRCVIRRDQFSSLPFGQPQLQKPFPRKSADIKGAEVSTQRTAERSRPLDVHRWSDYPELRNCLSGLVAEIEANENRQRRRTASGTKRLREAVRCLVLDLYVAWATDPELQVGVARGKSKFSASSRYKALFLSYDHFITAFNGLRDLGYLVVRHEGFNDKRTGIGRVSRVIATRKLVDLLRDGAGLTRAAIVSRLGDDAPECIIMRNSDKENVEYGDTPKTLKMRSDLKAINAQIAKSFIDIDISDEEFLNLERRLIDRIGNKDTPPTSFVDLNAKRLVRIFNNESWDQGGRFYGGWWQNIPSEYRQFITINGKRTVELDYSGMHVEMLYARVGIELEGDAYDIGMPHIPRNLVKLTFNKLLNASGAIDADSFDAHSAGMSWKEFQELIMHRHEPIHSYFRTGYGLYLQKQDADIANAIMLKFAHMQYVCLPVHDSFLVHHELSDELENIMIEEFSSQIGSKIKTKGKVALVTSSNNGIVKHEDAIAEALGTSGKNQGYNQRYLEWFACSDRVAG